MTEKDLQEKLDPEALVAEANHKLFIEYRDAKVSQITKLIHAINGLRQGLASLDADRKKKEQQLAKKENQLEQVKKGNWAVLFEKDGE